VSVKRQVGLKRSEGMMGGYTSCLTVRRLSGAERARSAQRSTRSSRVFGGRERSEPRRTPAGHSRRTVQRAASAAERSEAAR